MKKMTWGFITVIGMIVFSTCASPPAAAPDISGLDDLSRAIRQVSNYLNSTIPGGNMVAFVNVQSQSPALSDFIIDDLIANAVNDRAFSVVDRRQLEAIRAEQDFQFSGEVDDDTALSVGRFLGAQTIVSGRISTFGGHFRLTIRALDVQTALVQGQYNQNIGTERVITTLLGTSGEHITPTPIAATNPVAQQPTLATQTPARPTIMPAPTATAITAIEVTARSGGTLFFQGHELTTLWDGEAYTIPIDGPGTFELRMVTAEFIDSRSIVVNTRGITRVNLGGVFAVGDIGPAGGIIFYDRGRHIDGWRWLEAAPRDIGPAEWGAHRQSISGTSTALGTGRQNTQVLINNMRQRNESGRAAELAHNFIQNGFTDWFLPSREELNLMYRNLRQRGLGNFSGGRYWSSSGNGDSAVWVQDFSNGRQGAGAGAHVNWNNVNRVATFHIRPIRAF